ncbi:DUF5081 family protein [Pseudobutyrivibrio xylanivorans]|nr:DUF5081 family protein [Pseudobutyrivibrio xylanivorans]
MRFSSDELTFLTLMTNGPAPFGIFFDKIGKDCATDRAKTAKNELIKKGILSEAGITPKGFAAVKLWEEYRYASTYVVIKGSIIGLLENRRCIVIVKEGNDYEIASGDRTAILYSCLKEYPALQRGDRKDKVTFLDIEMDYETVRKKIATLGKNFFTLGVFSGEGRQGMERFIYWDDEYIYSYDPHTHTCKTEEPSSVRKLLVDALELNTEVLSNGV